MKRFNIIALAAAVSLTVCSLAVIVNGDELIYSSADDPLVSLSYINEVIVPKYDTKISELLAEITRITEENNTLKSENANLSTTAAELTKKSDELAVKVDELNNKLDEINKQLTELSAQTETKSPEGYTVVHMQLGNKLMAESPCEIILRSGTALAVSITENGINDITNGAELMNSDEIPRYHALLVPRGNDGRGIQITSDEAYVMVRGDYRLE